MQTKIKRARLDLIPLNNLKIILYNKNNIIHSKVSGMDTLMECIKGQTTHVIENIIARLKEKSLTVFNEKTSFKMVLR